MPCSIRPYTMPLHASFSEIPGVNQSAYVELSGTFEGESVTNFSSFWNKQVLQQGRRYFMLELSKLTTCSDEAIQCLRLFNDATAEKNGALAIIKPSAAVIAAMRSTGLGSLFTIFLEYKQAFEYLREVKAKQRTRELKERHASGDAALEGEDSTRLVGTIQPPQTAPAAPMQRLAQGEGSGQGSLDDEPPVPSGPQTQYQLRGYTGDGRTFHGGSQQQPPSTEHASVLLAVPDSREFLDLRGFLVDRIEAHRLSHAFLLPWPKDGAFEWMNETLQRARGFVGELTPLPATREMPASVAVASSLARLHLPPERILLLTSVSARPHPAFADLPHTLYKTGKQGQEQLATHLDYLLQQIESAGS